MKTPFINDIFSMIYQAFKNLYPEKECTCHWNPDIRDTENGTKVYGLTDFSDDGTIDVFVTPELSVADSAEIFAHELAHVAVGFGHDHDEVWAKAFDDIFNEYNRIGYERFDKHDSVEAIDSKACIEGENKTTRFEQIKNFSIDEMVDFIVRETDTCDFCSRKHCESCADLEGGCKTYIKEYLESEVL